MSDMILAPLTLLAADEHGTVLAAWEMYACGPAGLAVQVADLISSADRAPLGRVRRNPATYQVIPAEPAAGGIPEYIASPAYQRGYEQARHDLPANLLARIKDITPADGSWGADVLGVLANWFTDLGFSIEAGGEPV